MYGISTHVFLEAYIYVGLGMAICSAQEPLSIRLGIRYKVKSRSPRVSPLVDFLQAAASSENILETPSPCFKEEVVQDKSWQLLDCESKWLELSNKVEAQLFLLGYEMP